MNDLTQIFLLLKSDHFGKCFHLIFLYIMGYNIHGDPHDLPLPPRLPIPKSGGRDPKSPGLTPMSGMIKLDYFLLLYESANNLLFLLYYYYIGYTLHLYSSTSRLSTQEP